MPTAAVAILMGTPWGDVSNQLRRIDLFERATRPAELALSWAALPHAFSPAALRLLLLCVHSVKDREKLTLNDKFMPSRETLQWENYA